jgi:predicted DNA-binding transcriptional regulator YafY
MFSLYNLYESVILESVNRSSILDAIDKKVRVNIYYEGDDNTAPGKRTIEVYAYGISKGNNHVIRAYQVFGDSKRKIVPGWKLFRLDRITRWEPTNFKFYTPISDRDQTIPKFNESGDRSMNTIYKITKF